MDSFFADTGRFACWRVAAVVTVSSLQFADQAILAQFTDDHAAKEEMVNNNGRVRFSIEPPLNAVEEALGDQRLVDACICLSAHPDDTSVEGIAEHLVEAAQVHFVSALVSQSSSVQLGRKFSQGVAPLSVQLEGRPDERRSHGIMDFDLAAALVEIANRSAERIEALLETTADTLFDFFPEVPNVMGGDHREEVAGEFAFIGAEIDALLGEPNVNTLIGEVL
jgi:hypothetical protein